MMSIIVKDSKSGKLLLFSKGADGAILPKLHEKRNTNTDKCISHIDHFARKGLRTLVFSMRDLSHLNEADIVSGKIRE